MMIPFNDLRPLHLRMKYEIDEAMRRVHESGWFILGPEVERFEEEFARYVGARYAVGVANGTDAIELALRAGDIGPGDEVITVSHTAVPTVCAIERTGATPVLVEIDPDTYTMDPAALRAAITPRTRAVVPVHLYGQVADMTAICAIADQHGLLIVEDCAQAHGALQAGALAGTFGQLATFSFYPTKNLGALGDGGAVVTSDAALADRLRSLRNYGQASKYVNTERGVNSRLDEIQAAVLRAKLPHLDSHNAERQTISSWYDELLPDLIRPRVSAGNEHVYHLYVIRHPDRDQIQGRLGAEGIGALIHYPIPVHQQIAYADLGYPTGSLPVTEQVAKEILSLPLYIGLSKDDVARVCECVVSSVAAVYT